MQIMQGLWVLLSFLFVAFEDAAGEYRQKKIQQLVGICAALETTLSMSLVWFCLGLNPDKRFLAI